MRTLILLASLILTACGSGLSARDTGEFEPYVAAFDLAAQEHRHSARAVAITIHFGTVPTGAEAACVRGLGVPEIVISQEAWIKAGEARRHALLFHELGHCILGRDHTHTLSLMQAQTISGTQYTARRAYFLAELFR